jgi:uncharacterized protein
VLRKAIARVTNSLILGESRYQAILDFLQRKFPRLHGRESGAPLLKDQDVFTGVKAAIATLNQSYLIIQGPPGTGKTYLSACSIVELARSGKRIAVCCNSHKAILNLLSAVADQVRAGGKPVSIAYKIKAGEQVNNPLIQTTKNGRAKIIKKASVVGGTAWLFAGAYLDQQFDYLFVDEAGQTSLANLMVAGSSARNIVLVGDQMQLSQPIQGIHPGGSGVSCLDYVLQGERTVSPERGVFLPVTRRMHPAVCRIVSDLAYEGRLSSDEYAARQRIEAVRDLPPFGVVFQELPHKGNSQSSPEEAERITALFNMLLDSKFTDRDGKIRKLGVADILVVSPYNAQVNLITDLLPEDARVGTVDRFQGQEAPVCLISMATSSGEDLPRDVEFLFSLNRLNVALSRAQALAVLIASPRLLDVRCSTLDELRLVNALCAIHAYSSQ